MRESSSRRPLRGRLAVSVLDCSTQGYPCAVKASRTRVRLRVVPGTTHAGVVGRHGDAWKVRVTAAPEGGKANDAVLALLASTLDVPRRDLALTAGRASRNKVVVLTGVTDEEVDARLRAAAEGV